jgi:hypothetical protein
MYTTSSKTRIPSDSRSLASSAAKLAAANRTDPEQERKLKEINVMKNLSAELERRGREAKDEEAKLRHLNDAKKWNTKALTELAKFPNLIENGEEIRKTGCQISADLMDIYATRAIREPDNAKKIANLENVIKEAEEAEAHLHECKNSPEVSEVRTSIIEHKAHHAIGLSILLRDQAAKDPFDVIDSTEKINFLISATKYSQIAVNAQEALPCSGKMAQDALKSAWDNHWQMIDSVEDCFLLANVLSNELELHSSPALGSLDPAQGSLAASMLPTALIEELAKTHSSALKTQDSLAGLILPAALIEEINEAHSSMLKDLYACCETLQKRTGTAKHATYNNQIYAEYKEQASRRMATQVVGRYSNDLALLESELNNSAEEPRSVAEHLAGAWLRQQVDQNILVIGSIVLAGGIEGPAFLQNEGGIQSETLEIMLSRCDDIIEGAKWLHEIGKQEISAETIDRVDRLAKSAARTKDVVALRLKDINAKAMPKADSKSSRKQLVPSRPTKQPQSSLGKPERIATAEQKMKCQVIDTLADGKLIGTPVGDLVVVANITGQKFSYRQDGDKWVRHEDESMDFNAMDAAPRRSKALLMKMQGKRQGWQGSRNRWKRPSARSIN